MRSMTGYGRSSVEQDGRQLTIELKSVNHRFLDVSLRLPRNLLFLDQMIRERLSAGIRRGHVDVYLNVRNTEEGTREVQTDLHLARAYVQAARSIGDTIGGFREPDVMELMGLEGVVTLTEREMDQDAVMSLCRDALEEAISQLTAMRAREGVHLREDLKMHLDAAAELRESILCRAPHVVTEYRSRLESRLAQLGAAGTDPQRLSQEVALMADRCAIDEELARLESHIHQMNRYLETSGEIGKKMDFLVQEMNREANTIGSKASDAEIAQRVVDLKSEIEKLREQVQNVE